MKFSDDTGRLKVDLGNSAWRSVPILGNMAYQRDSGYFESIAVLSSSVLSEHSVLF